MKRILFLLVVLWAMSRVPTAEGDSEKISEDETAVSRGERSSVLHGAVVRVQTTIRLKRFLMKNDFSEVRARSDSNTRPTD
jgi:hypothetical protein